MRELFSYPSLSSNADHTIFKDPLASHDKGQASSSNTQSNVNYTHTSHNYVINCLRELDSCISIFNLKKEDPHCAATTRHNKITLSGVPTRPTTPSRPISPTRSITPSNYNLVDQLGKTPAQISILDLLRSSPQHQKVLDQALKESIVPNNIDVAQFQAMVGTLSSSHHITFSPRDVPQDRPKHNDPLYLEVFIHNAKVRHVLIDGGAGLNICTLQVVKNLGYTEEDVDSSRRIIIKAYDDGERFSKGVIILPIRIGLATENTLFQVLDIDMNCNMILGRL